MDTTTQVGRPRHGRSGAMRRFDLPGFAAGALAIAALAALLFGCHGNNQRLLPGADLQGDCPVSFQFLGGIWRLDPGLGSGSVLANCSDDSLNGAPVLTRGEQIVPCAGPMPCPEPPGPFSFDTWVALDHGSDGEVVTVLGTGKVAGDALRAEIRTSGCLADFSFKQGDVNAPLSLRIQCAGDLDEQTATMTAGCPAAFVTGDGRSGWCSIEPPLYPSVVLTTDSGTVAEGPVPSSVAPGDPDASGR